MKTISTKISREKVGINNIFDLLFGYDCNYILVRSQRDSFNTSHTYINICSIHRLICKRERGQWAVYYTSS